MSQLPSDPTPDWLAWVLPTVAALGIGWAAVKSYFQLASRNELDKRIAAQDEKFLNALEQQREDWEKLQETQRVEQLRLHVENVQTARETARETFGRIRELEKSVSRIEGRIEGVLEDTIKTLKALRESDK